MEGEEKKGDIFLGNLNVKRRKSGQDFMVGYVCLETLCDNIPDDMVREGQDGKHYIPVIIQKNIGGPDKNGSTHSISIDSYFPYKKNNSKENGSGK